MESLDWAVAEVKATASVTEIATVLAISLKLGIWNDRKSCVSTLDKPRRVPSGTA